jgi:hypothetical protein
MAMALVYIIGLKFMPRLLQIQQNLVDIGTLGSSLPLPQHLALKTGIVKPLALMMASLISSFYNWITNAFLEIILGCKERLLLGGPAFLRPLAS